MKTITYKTKDELQQKLLDLFHEIEYWQNNDFIDYETHCKCIGKCVDKFIFYTENSFYIKYDKIKIFLSYACDKIFSEYNFRIWYPKIINDEYKYSSIEFKMVYEYE